MREEADRAQEEGKLITTRFDDTRVPFGFREGQHIDLRNWDGTSSDPAFRKLVRSIKDKIDPPSEAEKAARLRGGSPVAPTRADGQMRLADTPLNTPPPKDDPAGKAARLKELWENTDDLLDWVAATGQLPEQIEPALRFFAAIRDRETPTWTALSFRRDALSDVLSEYPDLDLSHESLCKRLKALVQSVTDLEAYINPTQPEPGAPDEKPVQTDPIIRRSDFEEIGTQMEQLGAVFAGDDAVAALEPATLGFLSDAVAEAMQAARKKPFGERSEAAQFDTLKAAIKRVTYGVGALTAAEQTKNISKLLSTAAEEAFERLAAELDTYFDWLLTYF